MGRLLGIDYGLKRVGLAVSDELRMLASPLKVLPNNSELLKGIADLCEEYKIEGLVIGMPFSTTYREAEKMVRAFAEKIRGLTDLPVFFQDESFSSVYAETFLKVSGRNRKKRKQDIDKFAAQKILSDFLKSKG